MPEIDPSRLLPIAVRARHRDRQRSQGQGFEMRIFKSLLVSLIGLTALMYAVQNLGNVSEMRVHIDAVPSAAIPPALSWAGFAVITLCQLALAATALKGAWDLFAARTGSAERFREAKTTAVWAGGLSLLSWFLLALLVGCGLFQWGTQNGDAALDKAFALGTTSALTVLFVWGTVD
jgi:predicted small integral membrane protein